VLLAGDAIEALALVNNHPDIDLLLADVTIPQE
jgi:CheY-like chemotaxis protein